MAKKPSLTPREKKVGKALATTEKKMDNFELSVQLDALIELATVLQEDAYFKAIGVKVANTDVKTNFNNLVEQFGEVVEAYNKTATTEITITIN